MQIHDFRGRAEVVMRVQGTQPEVMLLGKAFFENLIETTERSPMIFNN
jgi:hypothetical protein